MIWAVVLLATTTRIGASDDGWTTVHPSVDINYDLENSPLQIRTDSEAGSNEGVHVSFYTQKKELAGEVHLYFKSPPQYKLHWCNTSYNNFQNDLPTETDRIWTLTLSRISGKRHVSITCNETEVLNVVLSNTTCTDTEGSDIWSRDVGNIYFLPSDTASDFYRRAPNCTGLKTEWTRTMKTETQFPVNPGTVVNVTCTYPDAENEGGSTITCTSETLFIFSKEPNCTMRGWTAVQHNDQIKHDLENSPLQIRTNSVVGSEEEVKVSFYNSLEIAGGVSLYFTSPPQYKLTKCNTTYTNFTADLTSETDKVWTITVNRNSEERRVVIHCNDTEVLNVVMSDTTCNDSNWNTYWSREVKDIVFLSQYDTASDYYRPAPNCTGLKTEWKSTMNTTTQFPVKPGTVVEVACLKSVHANKGSNKITCTTGTIFTFSIEPSCLISECRELKMNNATVSRSGPVPQGTVVTVTCKKSKRYKYVLIGNKEVTCQPHGWSDIPECRKYESTTI